MIDIIDYKPEHFITLDADDIFSMGGDRKAKSELFMNGPAITVTEDGEVIAAGGVVAFWKGVGEAWLSVSPKGRTRKVRIFKEMTDFLNHCFKDIGFHRIQTAVAEGNGFAHKCVLKLGFIPEGMMINYGPDKKHYVRYVRF